MTLVFVVILVISDVVVNIAVLLLFADIDASGAAGDVGDVGDVADVADDVGSCVGGVGGVGGVCEFDGEGVY